MKGLGAIAVAAVLATGCAASPVALATPNPAGKGGATSARTASPLPTGGKGGSPPPIPGVPAPNARCVGRPTGGPMVLIGQAIYDVTDAVHPKLLCQVTNTMTHLYTGDTFTYIRRSGDTGTEVVLHSIGSGNESVVAGWPIKLLSSAFGNVGAWAPDENDAATAVAAIDAAGNQSIQIWLFAQPTASELYEFDQPLTDCICRFGLAPPVLAFSNDAQFLVSGWPIGKGATALRVYRIADRTLIQTFDPGETSALWSPTGHRLYLSGRAGASRSWTPEGGFAPLAGSAEWPFEAGLSPDGSQVAYTAYADPANFADLRVYVYDVSSHKTSVLSSAMRSEVVFVKPGWVWYLEEAKCDPSAPTCGPWGTAPTGKVFAMDLKAGAETPVAFVTGQSPTALDSGWGPGEFWPKS